MRTVFRGFVDSTPVAEAVRAYERAKDRAAAMGRRWRPARAGRGRYVTAVAYNRALASRERAKRAIVAAAIRVFGRK